MTMTPWRPGNLVSAIQAPRGIPISAASTTADRLTKSDSRTMANSAGSPLSTSWRADTSSGIDYSVSQISCADGTNMVNFRNICIHMHIGSYAGTPHDRRSGRVSQALGAQALRAGGGARRALQQGDRALAVSARGAGPLGLRRPDRAGRAGAGGGAADRRRQP